MIANTIVHISDDMGELLDTTHSVLSCHSVLVLIGKGLSSLRYSAMVIGLFLSTIASIFLPRRVFH